MFRAPLRCETIWLVRRGANRYDMLRNGMVGAVRCEMVL